MTPEPEEIAKYIAKHIRQEQVDDPEWWSTHAERWIADAIRADRSRLKAESTVIIRYGDNQAEDAKREIDLRTRNAILESKLTHLKAKILAAIPEEKDKESSYEMYRDGWNCCIQEFKRRLEGV